jgi:hypothetical protein
MAGSEFPPESPFHWLQHLKAVSRHTLPSSFTNNCKRTHTFLFFFFLCTENWTLAVSSDNSSNPNIFFFFLVGPGFELRTLHLQSRCSTTWVTPVIILEIWRWNLFFP